MQRRPATRARASLSRGALISLLIHANVFAPLVVVAWIYGGREEAQRAEEVDVAFQDASDVALPPDLPPLQPTPDVVEPPAKKTERERKPLAVKPKPERQKPPEQKRPADAPEQKPEPEVVIPPMPPMPPPPKPPEQKAHEKMVDLDNDKNIPPPPDAKFLAQKNNRAEVETRATDTNLEKAQKGQEAASAPSDRTDEQVGGEKAKIAQLEDEKSRLGKSAPDVTPHVNPEVAQSSEEIERKKTLLALRDPAPKQHELTPETADLSLPRASDGDIPTPRRPVRGAPSDPSRLKNGNRVKLAINGKDYEYMFGADAEAERRLAQKMRSTKQGKFQQKQARIAAALENFIPEVKPGNQTALNTRAAPFAAYIARMHRSIHQLWGFGQLEDWDEKSGSNPFNNRNLLTTLEIVLNGDGTIDNVKVVQASGYLPYDVAAIDVAYSAGPYPDPPREIRSANGKIYIHWRFYRDERQCATSGVDYFILDNPPKGGDKPAIGEGPPPKFTGTTPPVSAASKSEGPRRLTRSDDSPAHQRKMAALDREVAEAEAQAGEDGAGAPSSAPSNAVGSSTPTGPAAASPRASDPAARETAERWFAALAAGDISRLVAMAGFPFRTSGKDVTSSADLSRMLADLASEGVRRPSGVKLVTAAALRSAIGKLPPNLDDGAAGQLYAATSVGPSDLLILVLGNRTGVWKPIGLVRR
jgi:TonB family protein